MTDPLILIIDDEPQIRRAVRHILEPSVGRVMDAESGRDGVNLVASARPALIVLDLGLRDMDGGRVCREIRTWSNVPILVLSARQSDSEKVALLDAGADDYVTKPFSPDELRARVRAQLRRAALVGSVDTSAVVEADGLRIDLVGRTVERSGDSIRLTPTEWDLLRALVGGAGRTLTHAQLFRAVWGSSQGDPQAYLRVHVANLRRKIERDSVRPRLVITEPGVGYRFNNST